MIKNFPLTDSQHQAWDKFCDDRAVLAAKEQRFLESCFRERGGGDMPWRFDYVKREFMVTFPDEQPSIDAGAARAVSANLPGPSKG